MAQRNFDFTGSNGACLSGRIELPETPPRGWAIFAHCFTCGKDSLAATRVSRALALVGIGVLRFDFAGLGASEGEPGEFGFANDIADLANAAQAMESAGMPVTLLVGHSLGGAAVLLSARAISTVRAIATIAAPADVSHILKSIDPALVSRIEKDGSAEVVIESTPKCGQHLTTPAPDRSPGRSRATPPTIRSPSASGCPCPRQTSTSSS